MDTNTRTPVEYAETILGVHSEHAAASELIVQLDRHRRTHVALVADVRRLSETIEDTEFQIATELRTTQEFKSEAAFDRQLRTVLAGHDTHRALKRELRERRGDADMVEAEVRNLELKVKLANSRLIELGGLLNFYASCKDAQTEARKNANDPLRNWP